MSPLVETPRFQCPRGWQAVIPATHHNTRNESHSLIPSSRSCPPAEVRVAASFAPINRIRCRSAAVVWCVPVTLTLYVCSRQVLASRVELAEANSIASMGVDGDFFSRASPAMSEVDLKALQRIGKSLRCVESSNVVFLHADATRTTHTRVRVALAALRMSRSRASSSSHFRRRPHEPVRSSTPARERPAQTTTLAYRT